MIFERDVPRKKLTGQMVWFGLWLFVTVVGAFILKPNPIGHGTHQQLGLPPCGSVAFFGRPCPGCGLTTSWTSILHGQVTHAFTSNWVGPLLYLTFTFTAALAIYGYIRSWRLRTDTKLSNRFLTTVMVIFLTYGAIRFIAVPYPKSSIWTASAQAKELSK